MNLRKIDNHNFTLPSGIVLANFDAPWSPPCQEQQAVLGYLAKRFGKRVVVIDFDIDLHRDWAMQLSIHSIPTLILFRDGKEIQRLIGLQPKRTLTEMLQQGLDSNALNLQT